MCTVQTKNKLENDQTESKDAFYNSTHMSCKHKLYVLHHVQSVCSANHMHRVWGFGLIDKLIWHQNFIYHLSPEHTLLTTVYTLRQSKALSIKHKMHNSRTCFHVSINFPPLWWELEDNYFFMFVCSRCVRIVFPRTWADGADIKKQHAEHSEPLHKSDMLESTAAACPNNVHICYKVRPTQLKTLKHARGWTSSVWIQHFWYDHYTTGSRNTLSLSFINNTLDCYQRGAVFIESQSLNC